MTKHDYIILGMVVAGIATNFLGAAFTIARIGSLLRQRSVEDSANGHHSFDNELLAFSFSLSTLKAELKAVRSFHEFVRVVEEHAAGHVFGTMIAASVAAAIMAASIALLIK